MALAIKMLCVPADRFSRRAWIALVALLGTGCAASEPPARPPEAGTPRAASEPAASDEVQTLSPQRIQLSLQEVREPLQRCLGDVRARVAVAWSTSTDGAVVDATLLGEDAPAGTGECVLAAVSEARFPAGGRRASGEWTFVSGISGGDVTPGRPKKRSKGETRHDEGAALEKGSPGKLPLSVIESRTMAAFPVFSHCIRSALERDSSLNGSLRFRFVVDLDGSIRDVENAESEVEEPQLLDCLAEGFYTLKFPQPEGGPAHVKHTLLLNVD